MRRTLMVAVVSALFAMSADAWAAQQRKTGTIVSLDPLHVYFEADDRLVARNHFGRDARNALLCQLSHRSRLVYHSRCAAAPPFLPRPSTVSFRPVPRF